MQEKRAFSRPKASLDEKMPVIWCQKSELFWQNIIHQWCHVSDIDLSVIVHVGYRLVKGLHLIAESMVHQHRYIYDVDQPVAVYIANQIIGFHHLEVWQVTQVTFGGGLYHGFGL